MMWQRQHSIHEQIFRESRLWTQEILQNLKANSIWFDNCCQSHSQSVPLTCLTVSILLILFTLPQKKDTKQERQNRKDLWICLLCHPISQALWTTNQNCISASDKWYLQQTSLKGRERAREWWITPKWEGGERKKRSDCAVRAR